MEKKKQLWHTPKEEPIDRSHCLINYGGNTYLDFELAFYNAKRQCFITAPYPHDTGYKVTEKSFEGGATAAVWKAQSDAIDMFIVKRWAYLSDILPLEELQ